MVHTDVRRLPWRSSRHFGQMQSSRGFGQQLQLKHSPACHSGDNGEISSVWAVSSTAPLQLVGLDDVSTGFGMIAGSRRA